MKLSSGSILKNKRSLWIKKSYQHLLIQTKRLKYTFTQHRNFQLSFKLIERKLLNGALKYVLVPAMPFSYAIILFE